MTVKAPPYVRQRRTLALLDAFGGSVHRADFRKLLFLYCQEPGEDPLYDFVPHRFGALSYTADADLRKLQERGLLAEANEWSLTEKGRRVARPERDVAVDDFVARHPLRGDALVAESYRRFPYHATRSEIVDRILSDDAEARQSIAEARPLSRAGGGLCTIGYQGRSLEGYLNKLIRRGVTLLCDVRCNPVSRKYGFSRRTLGDSCNGVGIAYEHLSELGIPVTQRSGLNSDTDYDALFEDYRRGLPSQEADLNRIADWIKAGSCVALTCYERLPGQCHRHCVADAIVDLEESALVVTHL